MRRIIGVFGAGDRAGQIDVDNARELGELIARRGWVVLTGGRNEGVMRAATEGARRVEGSITIGILPSGDTSGAADLDIAVVTGMGSARNNINVLTSDAVVACGASGPGTVSEIALALKARKPVVIIAASAEAEAFFGTVSKRPPVFVSTPADAIATVERLLNGD
jgi:uncharacterized protein (TIGR00725 family)